MMSGCKEGRHEGSAVAPRALNEGKDLHLDPVFSPAGEYTVDVPPGKMRIVAIQGFQWLPASAEVEIRARQATEVTLRLERPARLLWNGWRSGSTHVHRNYGGSLRNTPENLVRMARAEALQCVCSQAAN